MTCRVRIRRRHRFAHNSLITVEGRRWRAQETTPRLGDNTVRTANGFMSRDVDVGGSFTRSGERHDGHVGVTGYIEEGHQRYTAEFPVASSRTQARGHPDGVRPPPTRSRRRRQQFGYSNITIPLTHAAGRKA